LSSDRERATERGAAAGAFIGLGSGSAIGAAFISMGGL
jgi:hypothetical protein